MADRIMQAGPNGRQLRIAAREVRGDAVDDAWLVTFVPKALGAAGSSCHKPATDGGTTTFPQSELADWTETTIAGRPARIRELCGDVQAVITIGKTAFVLWLATPSIPGANEWDFRQIADTFRVEP
jgi:hypothetical protein